MSTAVNHTDDIVGPNVMSARLRLLAQDIRSVYAESRPGEGRPLRELANQAEGMAEELEQCERFQRRVLEDSHEEALYAQGGHAAG